MTPGEVIGNYHDLWHVEQSFRMSKLIYGRGRCSTTSEPRSKPTSPSCSPPSP
jgi:hypothetical protein